MQKNKVIIFSVFIISLIFLTSLISAFEVDNVLIKLSIKQQDSISKTLKITNTQSEKQDFEISSDLKLLSVKEEGFSLDAGESKTVELIFTSYDREQGEVEGGVYLGGLLISSNLQSKEIPIILEIETKKVLFDINLNVPPEYSNIYPGEKAIIEVKILNIENIGLKTIEMSYFVKDFQDNIIFSEQENLAVKTQVSTTKIISVPKDTRAGNYVFVAAAKYNNSIGTSSYLFTITKMSLSTLMEKNLIYVITGFVFITFIIIILFIFFTIQKDKIFLQLEKQHKKDLKKRIEDLEKRKSISISRVKKKKEKKAIEKGFETIKKQKIKTIKKIQKKRVKKLKQLRKTKKKSEIQKQINKWNKQGYDTSIIEPKKAATTDNMTKRIREWGKKGYNTEVLKEELNRKI